MNILNQADELMKRYLKAVARHLPLGIREDVKKEIESMILDICEERYGEQDVDQKRMESVLVELGSPSYLASKYREQKPLIGPELMPIFKIVLLVIVAVTATVSLINFALSVSGMSAAGALMYFLELFSSLTGIVGTVFIIFFILERAIKNKSEIDIRNESWKIADLPEIETKIPGRAEIIATFIFSAAFIIVLNLFIDYVGIYSFDDNGYSFTPVLAENIKLLLPLFSLRIAAGAVVLLPLIIETDLVPNSKRFQYHQIAQMALIIIDAGILIFLLSKGVEGFLLMDAFEKAGIENLKSIAAKGYTIVLTVLLILSGVSLVKRTLAILPKTGV